MKSKIIFQKDKYIVGITEDGKLFESYGNTYTRNILGAAGLYIQELQAEIAKLKNVIPCLFIVRHSVFIIKSSKT